MPSSRDLHNTGIKSGFPALEVDSLLLGHRGRPYIMHIYRYIHIYVHMIADLINVDILTFKEIKNVSYRISHFNILLYGETCFCKVKLYTLAYYFQQGNLMVTAKTK